VVRHPLSSSRPSSRSSSVDSRLDLASSPGQLDPHGTNIKPRTADLNPLHLYAIAHSCVRLFPPGSARTWPIHPPAGTRATSRTARPANSPRPSLSRSTPSSSRSEIQRNLPSSCSACLTRTSRARSSSRSSSAPSRSRQEEGSTRSSSVSHTVWLIELR
jgi:hypothetical protein